MTFRRFEPWNYLDLLHRDLDRLVGDRRRSSDDDSVADWTPAVDILEEKERFVLRADGPLPAPLYPAGDRERRSHHRKMRRRHPRGHHSQGA